MEALSVPNLHDAEPVGTVVEVHGPVVLIRCDPLPPLQQALVTENKESGYTFEVYQHLDRQHLRAITLENPAGLKRGMTVYDTGAPLQVPVSPAILRFAWPTA